MRLGLWAWLSIFVWCAGCAGDARLPPQTKRDRAQWRKVAAFEAPRPGRASVAMVPEDYVLSSGALRVVVGGLRRPVNTRGVLLEATLHGVPPDDGLVSLAPRLFVGGVSVAVRTERMFIIERAGNEVLRIEGSASFDQRVIGVARELSVGPVPGVLSTSTRLYSLRPQGEADVRVGARIAWGGPSPFVPGAGAVREASVRGRLVGARAAVGTTIFGFADVPLILRAKYEDGAREKLLIHTDVISARPIKLERGVPAYQKSLLVLGKDGLGSATRAFGFASGSPFPEIWGFVPYRPPGTQVRLVNERQRMLMTARPDPRGRVVLPVVPVEGPKPTTYVAFATAFGHAPSNRVVVSPSLQPRAVFRIPRGGQIRVRVRDASGGAEVPARVRILSQKGTPAVDLGPDYRAKGAGDTVIVPRGETAVSVPEGRYRVRVSHGPEWSIEEREVEVSETFSPRVDVALHHVIAPGQWVACDLHLHAAPSPDSEVSIADRLASLDAEGIVFAVPTDHNHVTDYQPEASALGLTHMHSVTGVEVTTWDPQLGHFNAFPYPSDPSRPDNGAPSYSGTKPAELFDWLHTLDPDMVVQVNHPRGEGGIGYFDQMAFDSATGAADSSFSMGFDAVEVFNGFDLARPALVQGNFIDWINMLARGYRVLATGSSDSHQVRYQLAGYPRTYVYVPEGAEHEPRAVVQALKRGALFVTSGPFLEASIDGGGPGTMVRADEGRIELKVRVRTPPWMEVDSLQVFVGAELVATRPLLETKGASNSQVGTPAARSYYATLPLRVAEDAPLVVRVAGGKPLDEFFGRQAIMPMAFTNPIFIDADGDGSTPWTKAPVPSDAAVPSDGGA